jgi:hypothetical protein
MACYFVCSAAIELCKFDDISLALRWLLRHIPLVSPFARDPDFRVLHPYAAHNEATFLQWNIGKQRAAEVGSYGYVATLHNVSKYSCMVSAFCNLFVHSIEQHFLVSKDHNPVSDRHLGHLPYLI